MKCLLSLEGLRPPLSRDSSTYTHAMSYFAWLSVGLPVKILKALLPSSILATCPAHLNLLDLITLTKLGERYKL